MPLIEMTDKEAEAFEMWRKQQAPDGLTDEQKAALIERARDEYAYCSDNNIEIDDDAGFSVAEDGVWVQAWVWLHNEQPE
jgi:hypothetical protein